MNMNQNPTREDLRALLAPCDDAAGHHVLWVKSNGDVLITQFPKTSAPPATNEDLPGAKLRFPAFLAGNEYVGPAATADEDWVDDLFAMLQRQWNRSQSKPNVEFADAF